MSSNHITKKCSKCEIDKSIEHFGKRKVSIHGMMSWCKSCMSQYDKARDSAKVKSDRNVKKNFSLSISRKMNYEKNRDTILARNRDYYARNSKKIIGNKRLRRSSDPFVSLKERIKSLIRASISRRGYVKPMPTEKIVGCSWDQFYIHIERQFTTGMSWDNRSEWHIDHIIPLATATCEDDIIRLNHFTNLRPLWAEDNLRKSDKLEHLI